jgi:hypothetical protein
MSLQAEHGTVEEHEPIETHLWVETSPLPTRLNRQDAGIGRGNVCAGRRTQDQHIGDPAGGLGRASLNQTTRDDLRQARIKTAIGNLARVIESRHVN